MRTGTSLSFVGLAVAAAITLSGCSGAGAGAGGGGGGGGELSDEDSPLGAYTSALWGEMDQATFDKQQAQVEKLVAACMKDEGFEYTPNAQNGVFIASSSDTEERDTEEWVASNGYGMVQPAAEAVAKQANAAEYADPNQDYLATLSESETNAFYETLHGPGPTEEEMAAMEEGGSYEYNWETSGCAGAAQHKVEGENGNAYSAPKYAALFEKMNAIYTTMQEDPKMKELDRSWASCMADAGYSDFSAKQDAFTLISDGLNAIYETMEYDPETGALVDDSSEAFAELKQQEIDIALADFFCSGELGYPQKAREVQFALEARFVDDNRAELDALRAEYPAAQ